MCVCVRVCAGECAEEASRRCGQWAEMCGGNEKREEHLFSMGVECFATCVLLVLFDG